MTHVDVARERGELAREVAVDDVDALVEHRLDPVVADVVAERVEKWATEERLDPLTPRRAELRPDEQRDPGLREVLQEALEDRLPEEPGYARDQHVLAGQALGDRLRAGGSGGGLLYHAADYALSTTR